MINKERLQKQVADSRQAMFDEGILTDYFLQLELIEESQPNFVEKIIGTYLTQSTLYLDELLETLYSTIFSVSFFNLQKAKKILGDISCKIMCSCREIKPLDMATVERLIQKLRGGSARFYAAYEKVRGEHAALRLRLEAYAELLGQLRDAVASDQGSENLDQEDLESVDSNDMNE